MVEVNTRKIETANSIKNNIDVFLKEEVFPKIEEVLANFDNETALIRLNRLDLQFSFPEKTDFSVKNPMMGIKLEDQIAQQISSEKIESSIGFSESEKLLFQKITPQQNLEQIFLFYIENGFYPWYGSQKHIKEFIQNKHWQNSFNNPQFVEKLKKLLKKDRVIQRFVFQYPSEIVYYFLSQINSKLNFRHILTFNSKFQRRTITNLLNSLFFVSAEKEPEKVVTALKKIVPEIFEKSVKVQKLVFWEIVNAMPERLMETVEIQSFLDEFYTFNQSKRKESRFFENKIPEQESSRTFKTEMRGLNFFSEETEKYAAFFETESNEIHIQNAGLILLHPFLKHFFEALNLIDGKNQIPDNMKFIAVQILHFLATLEDEFWEGSLVLEKFICGIPLQFPIPRYSLLTAEMKNETEILLKEVIKNWPALKNTSPQGLQQMFIQRNGKLVKIGGHFKLIVERKAQDVLMEKLNWNILLVKFPWKQELLTVEW